MLIFSLRGYARAADMLSSLYHISSPSLYTFVGIELYIGHGIAEINFSLRMDGLFVLGILKNDQNIHQNPKLQYMNAFFVTISD